MKKTILLFFFIISMGLVASYVTINSYVIHSAIKLEKHALRSDVELLANHINVNLLEKANIVKQMANYHEFLQFMTTLQSREGIETHPDYKDVMTTLDHIKNTSSTDVDLVFFVSAPANAIIKNNGEPVPDDWVLNKRQWYLDTISKGSTFISDPYPDAYSGKMVISVAEPAMNHNQIVGATGIDVSITSLTKMVATHKIGEQGYLILVDRNGYILSHPQEDLLLRPLSAISTELQKMLTDHQQNVTEYVDNDEVNFVTTIPIPVSGWSLLAIQPKAEAIKEVNNIQSLIITVFLGIFLLLCIVTFILLRTLENLRKTQDRMLNSEKMASLGKLVAGIAHELNTPLGVALTAVSFLKDITIELAQNFSQGTLKKADFSNFVAECDESTTIILSNILNASRLVKSFKQVSVDQSSDVRRLFKVKEYLDEILLTLVPILKKAKQSIHITCADDLELYGSPGDFSLIVTNLIMNSLTHAYTPQTVGCIRIEVTKDFEKHQLMYEDDGKGMDEATKSKIFDPFFTTQLGMGGTGLGLYLVYNVVTLQLGGTIECRSELGKGTKFIITIPRKDEKPPTDLCLPMH